MIDQSAKHLRQIDLFTGTANTSAPTPSTATPAHVGNGEATATPTRSLYRVELLPDGNTRITDHGRVTFHGMIRRARA
jgi:hypothetical protein